MGSSRLLPARVRAVLIFRENAGGFAVLIALAALLYGLYAVAGDGIEDWMDVAVRLVVVSAPLVVVGSFRETTAGGNDFWFQKPVDPVRFHLVRFLEVAFVATVAAVLFRCAAVAIGLAAGWQPDAHPLLPLPVDALTAVVVVAVGFGLACWWRDHGRVATAVYLSMSLIVLLQLDLLGRGPSAGPWGRLLRAASFPLGARREVAWYLSGRAEIDWRPLAWLLAYTTAWLMIGLIGVRATHGSRTR